MLSIQSTYQIMPVIENINWDFITGAILRQKTVLFLGQGATVNYEKPDNEANFFKEFKEKHPDGILDFHKDDGFLVFRDESAKLLNMNDIVPFYDTEFTNPVLEKLAEMPFHLIISVTPDLTLPHIFTKRDFAFQHAYYKPKIKQDIEKPTPEIPLLYNLLGCIKDEESLITSHYDLFNLIQSVYADKNLPDAITKVFSKEATTNIIFLGFDFGKWYFQLLLHLLRVNYDACIRYAAAQTHCTDAMQTLCESHFKISFVSKDLASFVDELHKRFKPEQLRKPVPKTQLVKRVYNKGNLLKFLAKAFNPTDFETFCMINFDEVYENFTPAQNQVARLTLLLDYVNRNNLYDQLLQLGKDENKAQFEIYQPYFEEQ